MATRTMSRMATILFSLLIIANQCFGFVQKTTKSVALHPAFGSMPGQKGSPDFIIGDTQQILAMAPNTDVEAELLTTMAHVTMDFGGFIINPSKHLLRYFAVLGRIFVISADYISDHSIHPEELMIQLFLMIIAVREIIVDNPASSNQTK